MTADYIITQSFDEKYIYQILDLQRRNLKVALTKSEVAAEGFVTCEHDFELLQKMNQPDAHIIALSDDQVIGYCLVMAPIWRNEVEVIRSMFDTIEKCSWNGKMITVEDYVTMGQVCVDKKFRKRGVFRAMYEHYRKVLHQKFKFSITEVATSNVRSLSAHYAIGFQPLLSYTAPDGKSWELVIWDWQT